jgi:hypothetical protein
MTETLQCVRCGHVGPNVPSLWRGFKKGRIICKKCYYQEYALANKEVIAEDKRRWIKADRERFKATQKRWTSKNTKKILARVRKYQASKINATPKWLDIEQFKQIEAMYINCIKGYEVDHIVPLQGDQVCGLHVPWNLQYLPMSVNRRKGNKHE